MQPASHLFTSLLTVFLLNLFLIASPAYSNFDVITGELPPYAYTQNSQLTGVATDIVKAMMQQVGYKKLIVLRPWARAIKMSHGKNIMIFPIARLPYREKQYLWIGPILMDAFTFAVQKQNTQQYSSIKDFIPLKVGVNRGAPTAVRLQKLGFNNLQLVSSENINASMLLKGRFDAWYTTGLMTQHVVKQLNQPTNAVRIAFNDITIQMYIAASLNLVDASQRWQKTLDQLKQTGQYQKILAQYGIHQ
ncbi:transporter substrate-binding domain-containing protein [Endozoicomonas sp. SM1973]|uniref:Transporter substrate-binding domain-containing protein n=1 Tax=Spartinivicinus marinus TaxID=2994442 RepID=A0A853HVG7_9GAMM|nr:transporter substrate-binding domain-containing protein [Spartinivicinus marinus]MCX4025757.1 transporter substrate-binding domain-containing protein [Spartinivicinus marinus]NYZ65750.1 transporter substrate-binding domain-containing protein [Spartinivicinus marinus]